MSTPENARMEVAHTENDSKTHIQEQNRKSTPHNMPDLKFKTPETTGITLKELWAAP